MSYKSLVKFILQDFLFVLMLLWNFLEWQEGALGLVYDFGVVRGQCMRTQLSLGVNPVSLLFAQLAHQL